MNRVNVPQLRFSGFDGEWEIKKLSDISRIERGRFSPRPRNNPIYYNGEIPFVQTSDVVNANGKIEFYTQTLNEKGLAVSKLFPKGSILITIAANIGHSGVLQIDMACPDSLIGIKPNKNIDNYYLNYYLSTHQKKMDYLAPEGAQKNINIEFLNPYKIPVTTLPEQQKIASFLSAVDEKTQQLSRKKQLLEQYKKGVMQQLFSGKLRFKDKNGKDYPDWEEKKLGEVAKFRRGSFPQPYGLPKWYDDENGMPFIQVYDVDSNMLLKNTTKNKISKLGAEQSVFVKKGTLVITIQGSIGRIAKTQYDAYVDRTLLIFQSYKLPTDVDYFKYVVFLLFEIEKTKAPGGTIKTITKEVLTDFTIPIPCIQEQQKIANFLSNIDIKIENTNQEINKMQNFKKGLLQKMFV